MTTQEESFPKHVISNSELFHKGRENVAHLIQKNMNITGGTDIDWMIERNGGFIIIECKEFSSNSISIPMGQMIAYERLHEKLSVDGKCYFYFFATEKDTDWTNHDSPIWYFRMVQWKRKEIKYSVSNSGTRRFIIPKSEMTEIPMKHFRIIMESHWNEFKTSR